MNNVWRLFRFDLGRLKANVMSIIIALGLVLVPSLFAWYNIIACWNVFDNTANRAPSSRCASTSATRSSPPCGPTTR